MKYRVYRGNQFLGTLTQTGGDMPWFDGIFEPAPEFAAVQSLFDHARELLANNRMFEWESAWEEIAEPGLRLEPLDGREAITKFLLQIEGRKASWKW